MKKQLFFIMGLLLLNLSLLAQKLTLQGANASFTKGIIDTETLSQIIQAKQEEVQQRVFKNMIVTYFWSNKDALLSNRNRLNNFTTQFMVYNLMKDITEGKNKKNITKNMVGTISEFSEVFAFATILALKEKGNLSKPTKEITNLKDFFYVFKDSLVQYKKIEDYYLQEGLNAENYSLSKNIFEHGKLYTVSNSKILSNNKLKVYRGIANETLPFINILLDVCFNVVLDDTESNTFTYYRDNAEFKRWFASQSYSKRNISGIKINLDSFKADVKAHYDNLKKQKEIIKTEYEAAKKYIDSVRRDPTVYSKLTEAEKTLIKTINNRILSLIGDTTGSEKVEKVIEYSQIFLELYPFITPVFKNNVNQVDEITKDQYEAVKVVLSEFSKLMRGHSKNDIISQLMDIVSGNFQYEIGENKKGIAYIDIEGTISQLFDNFDDRISSGIKMYAKPFFEIGTNTFFTYQNSNGFFKTIENSYFKNPSAPFMLASEKIGIKVMLINSKNAKNRKPGEIYRDRLWLTRVWAKAPKEPLFDDISLAGYASGILYNVANIRTTTNFNQPFIGVGLSFRFFNGLSLSANYAKTFKPVSLTEGTIPIQDFVGLNLDVPLIEYISAIRKKRTK